MAAALIKVTTVPSICGKKSPLINKWVRRISINNGNIDIDSGKTAATAMMDVGVMTGAKGSVALGSSSSNSSGDNGERFSVGWKEGWRRLSYAPFGASFPNVSLRRNLGKRVFSSFSGSTGGPVADMGSEDKDDRVEKERLQLNHDHHSFQQQLQPSRLLTLPTILTLARVAAVPLIICTFYMNGSWGTTATTGIFIVAAFTDWLDGYIARKMGLGTTFGAFLDPVADKLMVAATLVLLCTRPLEVSMLGEVPWLLTVPSIAIIGREITMSAVREWAASQNSKVLEAVAVNNLGKWKTATQMTALTALLAARDSSLTGSGILVASGVILLYISAGLAVWSLAVYMRKIWRMLLK
ncbi:CDP-diacylglycerol--glycerol-3-phosphate 3-phosphatidyltransferase 2-like isoform X2 [Macadamia integrifolia]|uniref:CDP-diacylglycerol--glycerol-3-phosphate 3-phosphatidyltransferase 2-like isoform X1 n=1 Tax=Macadamia integrifolia TaxID=60698 RepID=UPI001C4EE547|nr:CDP-diacylglycerol--glycerol-3-phosphate 3-phosphatidyltransferase 2-like isoform X1 [Macadamia integrifolia]XP_042511400.1 CDP-diacylglycerol--glycerol-3-phosphate 3-phosphatidyltransferase 2-like isoform X2 [Macadamia integrifolia]XP_042511401.1 CDP-diacylglycerol--glycerol-3-phosphate 3-phosphatidyltransferase 2-like isoform X2 [Macadamia integrifolia]